MLNPPNEIDLKTNCIIAKQRPSTPQSKHIAILGAMPQEVNKIIELMSEKEITIIADREYHSGYIGPHKATVVFSRWGKVAASSTVTTLITHFGCDCVVFTGVAGAVSDDLNIGDIVIADSTCQHDVDARPLFERFCIPLTNKSFFKPQEDLVQKALNAAKDFIASDELNHKNFHKFSIEEPRVYKGLIVTGDQFITDAASHEAIQSVPEVVMAVEMEGAAVAQVCDEHQVPYIIFRTISDKADHSANIDFIDFIEDIASQYSAGIIKYFLA